MLDSLNVVAVTTVQKERNGMNPETGHIEQVVGVTFDGYNVFAPYNHYYLMDGTALLIHNTVGVYYSIC